MIIVMLMGIGVYLFFGICLKKIAEKTGHQDVAKWWWVPIMQMLIPVRVAGKSDIWILLLLFIPLIPSIIVYMAVAEARGKESWWGIVAVIFPVLGIPYLAFSE